MGDNLQASYEVVCLSRNCHFQLQFHDKHTTSVIINSVCQLYHQRPTNKWTPRTVLKRSSRFQ